MKPDEIFQIARRLASYPPAPRISTAAAVDYIAEKSIWAAWRRRSGDNEATIILDAIGKLEHGLRSWSPLSAEGFLFGESVAEKLPPDYWREVQLDRLDHLRPDKSDSRTEQLLSARRKPVENTTVLKWAVTLRWPSFIAALGWAVLALAGALVVLVLEAAPVTPPAGALQHGQPADEIAEQSSRGRSCQRAQPAHTICK
jgi:hypothetical protein